MPKTPLAKGHRPPAVAVQTLTTFMIATDPYLQQFVQEFTETNKGKAYYSNLNGLGDFVFEDFEKNRKNFRIIF